MSIEQGVLLSWTTILLLYTTATHNTRNDHVYLPAPQYASSCEEEDAVTSYLGSGLTLYVCSLQMMCAILGPYGSAGCWVSLKDLMFFVNELPNLVDLMKD